MAQAPAAHRADLKAPAAVAPREQQARTPRADWTWILPIGPASRVLCAGRDAVGLARGVAGLVGRVVVLVDPGQRGTAVSTLQDLGGACDVVAGAAPAFAPGTFDLILLGAGDDARARHAAIDLPETIGLTRDGAVAIVLGNRRRRVRGERAWRRRLARAGWGVVHRYRVYADLAHCQWVVPADDAPVASASLAILAREGRLVRRAALGALARLVRCRVTPSLLRSSGILVAEAHGARAHR